MKDAEYQIKLTATDGTMGFAQRADMTRDQYADLARQMNEMFPHVHHEVVPAQDANARMLDQIREVIRDQHFALDTMKHYRVSMALAIEKIEKILGMEWSQGQEAERRKRHEEELGRD